MRYAGASGQLTLRADSGFYTHSVVSACREVDVRFSITIRQRASLRNLIEAIPEADWTPIPYWMDGAADVAETAYTPFESVAGAAPVRLIVRAGEAHARFPTGPLRQLQAITASSPTGTGIPWNWRPTIAATPRSRMPSETSSTAWDSTISRQAVSPPTAAWLAVQHWRITWPAGQPGSAWVSRS